MRCEILSSALVASSMRRMVGLAIRARAMRRRCFCPPLNPWLPSLTMVCICMGISRMSSAMPAISAARHASSMVLLGAVTVMLLKMSPAKRLPPCRQVPIMRLRLVLSHFERS